MKISDVTSALSHNDVVKFKKLFDNPIPMNQAIDTISKFFIDSDLFAIIDNELQVNGNIDARDLIVGWLKQNMPDLYAVKHEPSPGYESPISSHPDIKGE
jgi:hypothetical protein